MKAACGPYIAAWKISAMTAASTISANCPVSSSAKKTKTQIADPMAPIR